MEPSSGRDVVSEHVVLASTDGTRLAAFSASPADPASTVVGVVILPDVRGLHAFYEQLALRFAEHGIVAFALDYFGRTAGVERRPPDFDYRAHVAQTTFAGHQADLAAAVADLRSRGCRAVFTVGFCFGGRPSWLAAAEEHGVAGAIGCYGRPGSFQDGTPGPIERAGT